jgi:hypothetical protein
MAFSMRAAAVGRVEVSRGQRIAIREGPVIANVDPEPARARLTLASSISGADADQASIVVICSNGDRRQSQLSVVSLPRNHPDLLS